MGEGEDRGMGHGLVKRCRDHGGLWRHGDKAGRAIDAMVTANAVCFARRPARMVVVQDVAKSKRSEKALAYRTRHDPRTEMFDEGARARMELRVSVGEGLRRALDREQFAVLYQPVVSLATGKMVGAEALLRWNDPERGVIGPDQFVPLAEETGLIVPIGAWVLERACRDAARWNDASALPLTVSVNVSGRQLEDTGLVVAVERALTASGLPAPLLILEITETALIEDFHSSLANLDALRGLGTGLAIDDFGTGYSSLSYLSRLPLDIIKIDKSFVEGLGTDSPHAAIVTAITTMSRSLGFRVLAEGVETHRQAAALQAMACDLVQGFFFAGPVPDHEMMEMITAG
jgi:EAL domain-containing protein (putative c-di-GMP-specific phosphodiesterase class I)